MEISISDPKAATKTFEDYQKHFDAPRSSTPNAIYSILRGRYPDWNVHMTPSSTKLIQFAKAGFAKADLVLSEDLHNVEKVYLPPSNRLSKEHGQIMDHIIFGRYNYAWNDHSFIVFLIEYEESWGQKAKTFFILAKREQGPDTDSRTATVEELIKAAVAWSQELHEEFLVFDQEMWLEDKELYQAVKSSFWDTVILSKEMKENLISDVEGFFDCQKDYQEFAVPWKRGVIFHGTPGNGKTISIKAIMNALARRSDPIPTLYVKSLAGCHNAVYAIRQIFVKARQMSPCLLIFEDLDSLISDQVKSFFLNEVDGLEDNNGLMMIGSTKHLERLDAGISNRPSRFDRKYHFALPAIPERTEYCNFWRGKLAKNKNIEFPETLSAAIAEFTDGFSFAYLKEVFVTSLLVIVGAQRGSGKQIENISEPAGRAEDGFENVLLWKVIRKQVQTLRKEMEAARKSAEDTNVHRA